MYCYLYNKSIIILFHHVDFVYPKNNQLEVSEKAIGRIQVQRSFCTCIRDEFVYIAEGGLVKKEKKFNLYQ